MMLAMMMMNSKTIFKLNTHTPHTYTYTLFADIRNFTAKPIKIDSEANIENTLKNTEPPCHSIHHLSTMYAEIERNCVVVFVNFSNYKHRIDCFVARFAWQFIRIQFG